MLTFWEMNILSSKIEKTFMSQTGKQFVCNLVPIAIMLSFDDGSVGKACLT